MIVSSGKFELNVGYLSQGSLLSGVSFPFDTLLSNAAEFCNQKSVSWGTSYLRLCVYAF